MKNHHLAISITLGVAVFFAEPSDAQQPLTSGNILLTGGNNVYEVTSDGDVVQTINVPNPTTRQPERVLDSVVDQDGRLHVFNSPGSGLGYLSTLDIDSDSWVHTLLMGSGGYSTGSSSFNDIGIFGDFVFAGGARIDVRTFEVQGYGLGQDRSPGSSNFAANVAVGLNGALYMTEPISPSHRVHVNDPADLSDLSTVELFLSNQTTRANVGGVTADENGNIFAADFSGQVHKYNSAGTYIGSHLIDPQPLSDIDLNAAGQLVVSGRDDVFVTDTTFGSITRISTDFSGLNGFNVAWVRPPASSIPEPAALFLLIGGAVGSLMRRQRFEIT